MDSLFELTSASGSTIWWLKILLDLTVKSAFILAIAGLITLLLRRTSASIRHLVWTLALAGLLVVPFLSRGLPDWRVPIFSELSLISLSVDKAEKINPGTIPNVQNVELSQVRPGERNVEEYASPESDVSKTPAGAKPQSQESQQESGLILGNKINPSSHRINWIVVIWVLGALFVMFRLLIATANVWWLTQRAGKPDDRSEDKLAVGLAEDHGLNRPIRVLISSKIKLPMMWGFWRPVILLPADSDKWSPERRRIVLLHELAHAKRNDCLIQGLSQFVCALYWFNPLVWLAKRQIQKEHERACDDYVLDAGTKASEYANHLLDVVRSLKSRELASVATVAMARRSQLEGRLLAILNPNRNRAMLSPLFAAVIVVVACYIVLPVAAMDFWQPSAGSGEENQSAFSTNNETGELAASQANQTSEPYPEDSGSPGDGDAETSDSPNVGKGIDPDSETEFSPQTGNGETRPGEFSAAQDTLVINSLILALEDVDWEVRKQAVWALGEMEDARAIEALSDVLLHDDNWEVREQAAQALGDIEDRRAAAALKTALLNDAYWQVRREAAEALGHIEDPGSVEALSEAVRDENREVRREAIDALGHIEDSRSVEPLMKALEDVDWEIRKKAAEALGDIEAHSAVEVLIAALADENSEVRKQAAWALGKIENPRSVDALSRALEDENWEVRQQAVEALCELRDYRTVEPLIQVLSNDMNRQVREEAAETLGEMEDRRAVAPLIKALKDEHWQIRKKAAWALGKLEDSRAIEPLTQALKDENKEVRSTAAWALGQIR